MRRLGRIRNRVVPFERICPKCGGEMHERFPDGVLWCPSCVGRQMAEEVTKKVKLNLTV